MRFNDILVYSKEYLLLGIIAVLVLGTLFSIGYSLIYKKLIKGKKTISIRHVVLTVISVCYIIVVLGAVFLNRGSHYNHTYVLQPFNSYLEAWNQWSAIGWRSIIFNILMFVPLGFLLPYWSEKLRKAWKSILFGFLFSFVIELVQFITSVGIFDVDDLIGNTFGTWLGYGLGMLALTIYQKKNTSLKKILGDIVPLLIMAVAIGGIFTAYSIKELGNLSCSYSQKVNMEKVSLTSEISFSNNDGSADIYSTTKGSELDTKALAEQIFSIKGTTIDNERTDIYDESALYYSKHPHMSVWVTYRGMSYNYTDFTMIDKKDMQQSNADEAEIRTALAELNIKIPEDSSFEITEKGYEFTVDMVSTAEKIIDGTLTCDYYSDGTIGDLDNGIVCCNYYRTCDIISEAEAYQRIEAGKFVSDYLPEYTFSLIIKDVKLDHTIDSKGYYQPVYKFNCLCVGALPEYQTDILIPAMK